MISGMCTRLNCFFFPHGLTKAMTQFKIAGKVSGRIFCLEIFQLNVITIRVKTRKWLFWSVIQFTALWGDWWPSGTAYRDRRSPRFTSYLLLPGWWFFPFLCYIYTRKDAMKMSKYIECLVYEVTLLKSIEYANKLVR